MRRIILFLLLFLTGCLGIPEGVKPVTGFELNRYLGTWYEIARLDHSFERGLVDVKAEYSMLDNGGVRVINSGVNVDSGQRETAIGRAYFIDRPDIGRLKVSFFGPFFGSYNIIALDKVNYSYVMIAGNTKQYLWILARSPVLDNSILQILLAQAKALGFATEDLIYPQPTP